MDGRIIKGIGGLYTVSTSAGVYGCGVRGIFRKEKITPTIGDFVSIEILDESQKEAVINQIHARKTELIRPRVANIDQAIIIFAIKDPAINLDLLDRFIILAEEQNLEIIIGINKIDLDSANEAEKIKDMYAKIDYPVVCTVASDPSGVDKLRSYMKNKVSVFAGPSGVGKSSMINALLPHLNLKTGQLSEKISRGKHTTRHTELIEVDENSFILDSPGFTALSLSHIPKNELAKYFREFRPFIEHCKFRDCLHIKEKDCAVKEQVGKEILPQRYECYVKLM